ncbi:ribosome biogenesis protein SLX9-domain-containing protein [Crassisporium funariophilum]|nr:ribosome biogenesis protein SLX9-domain-containing protein [Crassisporium funariophilum]
MPKATRVRRVAHHPSVKLNKGVVAIPEDLPSLEGTQLDIPQISSPDNEEPIAIPEAAAIEQPVQQSKKEKQIEKREAFMKKLEPTSKTFSKSHERRMKRKAKEQLTGTMGDLQSALASLDEAAITSESSPVKDMGAAETKPKAAASIKIGKGASATLSKNQRKRLLEMERFRHPLILTNSEYASNPFKTIRTHAQNTLMKHQPPA